MSDTVHFKPSSCPMSGATKRHEREMECRRIQSENRELARRLQEKSPVINREQMEREYQQHLEYLNITRGEASSGDSSRKNTLSRSLVAREIPRAPSVPVDHWRRFSVVRIALLLPG